MGKYEIKSDRHFVDRLANEGIPIQLISNNLPFSHLPSFEYTWVSQNKNIRARVGNLLPLIAKSQSKQIALCPLNGTLIESPLIQKGRLEIYATGFSTTSLLAANQSIYQHLINKQEIDDDNILSFDETICGLGGHNVFGHFILESLLRMEVATILGNEQIKFIIDNRLPEPFEKIASYLGILPKNIVKVDKAKICTSEKAIIGIGSTLLSLNLAYSRKLLRIEGENRMKINENLLKNNERELNEPFNRLWQGAVCKWAIERIHSRILYRACGVVIGNKYFILRNNDHARLAVNRKMLAEIAISHDYIVIKIEEYTIQEQIAILASCRFLISELGSSSCNAILMPKLIGGIELTSQNSTGFWSMILPSTINKWRYLRLSGKIVDGKRTIQDPNGIYREGRDSDFYIDEKEFEQAIICMKAFE